MSLPLTPFPGSFDTATQSDKPKHHAITPEPGTYGIIFVGVCVALLLWRRAIRRAEVGPIHHDQHPPC